MFGPSSVPSLLISVIKKSLNPLFINRIAYGTKGFPWKGLESKESNVSYTPNLCPVAERLHNQTYMGIGLCQHFYTNKEIDLIIAAFHKVWDYLDI